jgi:hypothetical protein
VAVPKHIDVFPDERFEPKIGTECFYAVDRLVHYPLPRNGEIVDLISRRAPKGASDHVFVNKEPSPTNSIRYKSKGAIPGRGWNMVHHINERDDIKAIVGPFLVYLNVAKTDCSSGQFLRHRSGERDRLLACIKSEATLYSVN